MDGCTKLLKLTKYLFVTSSSAPVSGSKVTRYDPKSLALTVLQKPIFCLEPPYHKVSEVCKLQQ